MSDSPRILCLYEAPDCPAQIELSRLRKELQSLELQVIRDPLTGLYNKRHFDRVLDTEMERSRRSLQTLSIILLDLDHFKAINDSFGHPVGDHVLQRAAQICRDELRMIDVPCRYGGEEFVIILPATPLVTAMQVAERLRLALKQTPITTPKGDLMITASFGVSAFRHEQKISAAALVDRADQKLYEAKRSGRDRVCADAADLKPSSVNTEERAALWGPPDAF